MFFILVLLLHLDLFIFGNDCWLAFNGIWYTVPNLKKKNDTYIYI